MVDDPKVWSRSLRPQGSCDEVNLSKYLCPNSHVGRPGVVEDHEVPISSVRRDCKK